MRWRFHMNSIRTFSNTKCELEMAKTRLKLLMDRKEQLYCKYFPITKRIKEIMVDGGEHENDKMALYLSELHDVDLGTGKSLAQEIAIEQETVYKLQMYMNEMESLLGKMTGIEYDLFYEIIVNGTPISRAVGVIAEKYEKDTTTIWKYHYKKIKKDVKNVIKYSETPVNYMI